jgi:hypothetical protein
MAREPTSKTARELLAAGNAVTETLLTTLIDEVKGQGQRTERAIDNLRRDVTRELAGVHTELGNVREAVAAQGGQLAAVQLHGEAQALRSQAPTQPSLPAARADPTGPLVIESERTHRPAPTGQTSQQTAALGPRVSPVAPPTPVPIFGPGVSPPIDPAEVARSARTLGAWAWERRGTIAVVTRKIMTWGLPIAAGLAALLWRLCGPLLPPSLRDRDKDHGGIYAPQQQLADADDGGGKKKQPTREPEKPKKPAPPVPDPKRDRRVQPKQGERTAIDGPGEYEDTTCNGGLEDLLAAERCGPKR